MGKNIRTQFDFICPAVEKRKIYSNMMTYENSIRNKSQYGRTISHEAFITMF